MLRFGCIVLTIWGAIQFLVSLLSLAVSVTGKYAPMMKIVFTDEQIDSYDIKILTLTKSLAIMHNTGATVQGVFILFLTWFGIHQEQKWALWILLLVGILMQTMWFVSDAFVGNKTLIVNIVLTTLFVIGITISGLGLYKA